MSYGYNFTGDALADLRELSPETQEYVLDVLEDVVNDPPPDFDNRPVEVERPAVADSDPSLVIRGVWSHTDETFVVIGVRVD